MNKLILFFIVAMVLGCSKETPSEPQPPTGTVDFSNLIGRWRYEEVQISPNTPIMQEVQQIQGRVIEFRSDSTYRLSLPDFSEEGIFRMRGSRRIWFNLGPLDEQFKEIDELTQSVMRGRILVMSDDSGSWQQVGTARVRLVRVP
jgi:hypothetical protein